MNIDPSLLDAAEERALKKADEAAYYATERVNPQVQQQVFNTMRVYIATGIRLMRAEVESLTPDPSPKGGKPHPRPLSQGEGSE